MEEKAENQDNNHPSLLPNHNTTKEESPRKPIIGGSSDRLKRDEWSEGAVSTLLEAYEAKWVLRNRAKLKGHDWEDVAKYVSSRANSTKSPKTQTQCKNKIESMKKSNNQALILLEPSLAVSQVPHQPPPPFAPPPLPTEQNSHGSNGVDRLAKEEGLGTTKSSDHVSNKNNPLDTDSSTPALYSEKDKSIRWLAEVVVRSEQTRMDTLKEIEKMRVEAEAKRGEMDLKRTEIIANTQLEIARIFASVNKGVDSSLRIGRS
ncbi:Myb/SANT-like DNA-binding domain [Sesbania bispinosa]|nr:Myb/SANT-like DNA-binding domain [Sesbania bispinosa]